LIGNVAPLKKKSENRKVFSFVMVLFLYSALKSSLLNTTFISMSSFFVSLELETDHLWALECDKNFKDNFKEKKSILCTIQNDVLSSFKMLSEQNFSSSLHFLLHSTKEKNCLVTNSQPFDINFGSLPSIDLCLQAYTKFFNFTINRKVAFRSNP